MWLIDTRHCEIDLFFQTLKTSSMPRWRSIILVVHPHFSTRQVNGFGYLHTTIPPQPDKKSLLKSPCRHPSDVIRPAASGRIAISSCWMSLIIRRSIIRQRDPGRIYLNQNQLVVFSRTIQAIHSMCFPTVAFAAFTTAYFPSILITRHNHKKLSYTNAHPTTGALWREFWQPLLSPTEPSQNRKDHRSLGRPC